MDLKKIGVGVVGTGMAAKPHAQALNDLKKIIDIKGVFSRNAEKCQIFANKYEMPFTDNIDDLVKDSNLDMVIIITPPNQRLELIEKFRINAITSHMHPDDMQVPEMRSVLCINTYLSEFCW